MDGFDPEERTFIRSGSHRTHRFRLTAAPQSPLERVPLPIRLMLPFGGSTASRKHSAFSILAPVDCAAAPDPTTRLQEQVD